VSRVAIVSAREDTDSGFTAAMSLAGCDEVVRPGARVLVKPNWNAAAVPGSTSMAAVQAACRWAHARGAGEVLVGEGPVPVGRARIDAYLAELGVPEQLAAVGARFVLFDDEEHVLFRDREDLPREVGIARHALEADVVINLPLLKVHSCCLATLCLKNLKGCLRPQDKMAFHHTGLLPAIVALNGLLQPHIHIIDALDGMEGDHNRGPTVPLGLFIAGRDPVAVDAVGCAQMGLEPHDVPLLRMATAAGLGEHDLERIALVGEPLHPHPFELPQDHLRRLYPDLSIDDAGACSACRAALMDGLYAAGGERRVSTVALGKHAQPAPDALVLGQCLRDYWPTHPHVVGCPPSGHAIAESLCAEEAKS